MTERKAASLQSGPSKSPAIRSILPVNPEGPARCCAPVLTKCSSNQLLGTTGHLVENRDTEHSQLVVGHRFETQAAVHLHRGLGA